MTNNTVFLLIQLTILICSSIHSQLKKPDWGRYLKDMTYLAYVNNASANKDMAMMQQIVTEMIAEKKRYIFLEAFPLNHKNAIFFKAVIETIRMEKKLLLVLAAMVLLILSLRTLEILPQFSIGDVNLGHILSASFVTALRNYIHDPFHRNIASIFEKHRSGFILPYPDRKIVASYFYAAAIATTFFYTIIALIHQAPLIWLLIVIPAANGLELLTIYIAYRSKKKRRIVDMTIGAAFYALCVLVV